MPNMIKLIVDDQQILAEAGQNLLQACLDNGIYIPNLCFLEEMTNPPASCRLCLVEIEGEKRPVPACKTPVAKDLVVRTNTPALRRLQRSALRLLLTVHNTSCRNCAVNRKCPLQRMARLLGNRLRPRRLPLIYHEPALESDHPFFDHDPLRCVLCGKCVYVCHERNGFGLLTFAKRGFDTVVTSFGVEDQANLPCKDCRACVDICPVAAIFLKEEQPLRLPCRD
jgi:bidirectional [NiFe] hydrogenase diaphorase subunit